MIWGLIMIIPFLCLGNSVSESFECSFDSEGINISWELLILLIAYCIFEMEIYYVMGVVFITGGLFLLIMIIGIIFFEIISSQLC